MKFHENLDFGEMQKKPGCGPIYGADRSPVFDCYHFHDPRSGSDESTWSLVNSSMSEYTDRAAGRIGMVPDIDLVDLAKAFDQIAEAGRYHVIDVFDVLGDDGSTLADIEELLSRAQRIEAVARRFHAKVQEVMTPEELVETDAVNKKEPRGDHLHDLTDPNHYMDEAYSELFGPWMGEPNEAGALDIINAAWDRAKAVGYSNPWPPVGNQQGATSALDPADVATINRHRRSIGGDPIDLSAGWTPGELHDMAENIRSRGTEFNPAQAKLKSKLMR